MSTRFLLPITGIVSGINAGDNAGNNAGTIPRYVFKFNTGQLYAGVCWE